MNWSILCKVHLEGLLSIEKRLCSRLDLVHVLAAVDFILQRVFLVEVSLLEIFLEAGTEVSAHLTLQVAGHTLPLELDHPKLWAGVGQLGVVKQGGDAADLLR